MNNYYYLKSNRMIRKFGLTAVAAIMLAGCASVPAPVEQMAVSRSAVNAASSSGANEFAPLLLKSAMEKMDAAEKAMAEKNYVLARQMAEQAQVDAQLAAATARSAKAQKAADALKEDRRVLQKEIDRKSE